MNIISDSERFNIKDTLSNTFRNNFDVNNF